MLDNLLSKNKNIITVKRYKYLKEVFHLYHINVKKRDALKKFLIKKDIDAKIHYPIPIHLQKAAKYLNSPNLIVLAWLLRYCIASSFLIYLL